MPKKIWIDLDNSPHVPFFAPIIEELEGRGYRMCITIRDAFQVTELAVAAHLNFQSVGHHFGKNRIAKVTGLAIRAAQLLPLVRKEKPDLAISHGSRAQLVASVWKGVPSMLMMDYEYARGLTFARPAWVMVPEPIPTAAIPVANDHVLKYPGIKEDVYVPRFRPTPHTREELGIADEELLVTVRPPANEAHYHTPESDRMFDAALEMLCAQPQTRLVMLPRNHSQELLLRERWSDAFASKKICVPPRVVDGLNLIWHSDLVVSGGGTMNREAAALGVPVYSVFRGKIGAVDRYLASMGRLVLLEKPEDVHEKIQLRRRATTQAPSSGDSAALNAIVAHIATILN
jgi:uncharacterized protein